METLYTEYVSNSLKYNTEYLLFQVVKVNGEHKFRIQGKGVTEEVTAETLAAIKNLANKHIQTTDRGKRTRFEIQSGKYASKTHKKKFKKKLGKLVDKHGGDKPADEVYMEI